MSVSASLPGPVIAILGPTAVGKSALADEIAVRLGTEVISADAMQVYRGMDIGTAKTPLGERRVPLRLIDMVEPSQAYSAACFQSDARAAMDALLDNGKIPVLCGGTGLYVTAALDAMEFPKGDVGCESRSYYQHLAEELGDEGLHKLLADRDPKSAGVIHPHNVRRVVRALEMLDEGVSYADQKSGFSCIVPVYQSFQFALYMDRDRLYRRINERVDLMVQRGLIEEVQTLVHDGFAEALTSRQAIGYKEIIDALEGRMTQEEAIETIKLRSRRYARRQLSWFKRDKRIHWISMDQYDISGAADLICRAVEA